jgi:hypothetical protein
MRTRLRLASAALVIGALPAACAFVLDFDELQAGGGLQDASDDGACNCPSDNPCRPQICENGKCVPQVFVGLADDGYQASFQAEQMYRITLSSVGDAFYGSIFYDDGAPRLRFFKIPINQKAESGVQPQSKLSTELAAGTALVSLENAVAASAAGLVSTGPSVLATFGTTTGNVFALYITSDLTISSSSQNIGSADYSASDPYRHPHAWTTPAAYIGWITNAGKVRVSGAPLAEFGDGAVTAFGPLLTGGGPAVAWMEAGSVFARHRDQATPLTLADCPTIKGWTPVGLTTFGAQGGLESANVAAWTKTSAGMWAVQSRALNCTHQSCKLATTDPICKPLGEEDDVAEGLRNLAWLASRIPEQEATKYYQIFATSLEGGGQRQVWISASELDSSTNGVEPLGDPIGLTPLEPASEAGDYPALAFSGIDKILVGWVHPGQAHVRRYRICPPPKGGT